MDTSSHDNPPAIEVNGSPELPLGMPVADFLRHYWQKHPLLVRSAFPDFSLPLQPEDLAGLACEETALSRLVRHNRQANAWELRHGPFDDDDFAALPEHDWTLLVEDVDKWDADVALLLDTFGFMPLWRIDDIMVSYAVAGGGVGAHIDQYDVFLLQGMGRRRWAIDMDTVASREYRSDTELRLLKTFSPSHEWVLQAGDLLYLPPGIAHDGVAEEACMTFSIGMRAPAVSEMLVDCAEYRAERMPESLRYTDADLTSAADDPGQIDPLTLDRLADTLGPMAHDMSRDALGLWFGSFITRYRSAQLPAAPEQQISTAQVHKALQNGAMLLRHPWTRLAWLPRGRSATLFASGDSMPCPANLANLLCRQRYLQLEQEPDADALQVLCHLINSGHLHLSAEGVNADG
ncbi:MAG: cupin domain-containing protein [Rhodanobacteraceae bacterium]